MRRNLKSIPMEAGGEWIWNANLRLVLGVVVHAGNETAGTYSAEMLDFKVKRTKNICEIFRLHLANGRVHRCVWGGYTGVYGEGTQVCMGRAGLDDCAVEELGIVAKLGTGNRGGQAPVTVVKKREVRAI